MYKIAKEFNIKDDLFLIGDGIEKIPQYFIFEENEYYYFLHSFINKILPNSEEIQKARLSDFIDKKEIKILEDLIIKSEINYFPVDGMKHQDEAFNNLKDLKVCILDGDTGVGKTKIYIDLADNHYIQSRIDKAIVIAPPITIDKFKKEVERFSKSSLNWAFYSCFEFSKKVIDIKKYNVDKRTLIILDESHRIKNIESNMTRNLIELSFLTDFKIIGTGTLIPNNPIDLVCQSNFISRYIYGLSMDRWKKETIKRFAKRGDKGIIIGFKNIKELISAPFPYIYSIRKKDVLKELEAVSYNAFFIENSKDFSSWVKEEKEKLQQKCNKQIVSYMGVLQELRKIAYGFGYDKIHPKTKALKDLLEDISKDEKIIIWNTMYCEIPHILKSLEKREDICFLNGNSNKGERIKSISDFRFGNKNILIATQAVGGEGLDLFESCINIYFSNSFNYKDREQSEGRTHRLGQKRGVIYYDLVVKETIDNRIYNSISRKQSFLNEFKELCDKNMINAIEEVL